MFTWCSVQGRGVSGPARPAAAGGSILKMTSATAAATAAAAAAEAAAAREKLRRGHTSGRSLDRAHGQSRPTVLEIETYRYYGHSVADAKHKIYRSEEEIERYKQDHDPIRLWKARLLTEGVLTEEKYEELDQASRSEANESVQFAEESPIPSDESITEDVYFEVDRQTTAGRTGRHFFN
jgi:TPP-dependent pyruvate/acetoin dehydrogenase alpha subunit